MFHYDNVPSHQVVLNSYAHTVSRRFHQINSNVWNRREACGTFHGRVKRLNERYASQHARASCIQSLSQFQPTKSYKTQQRYNRSWVSNRSQVGLSIQGGARTNLYQKFYSIKVLESNGLIKNWQNVIQSPITRICYIICHFNVKYYFITVSGVDPNLFWGGKNFPSQGRGRSFGPKGWKPEAQRAESRVGFLGRGQRTPPHQLGDLGECCKLPPGARAEPRKIWNLVQLETSKFTTEMPYNM